MRHIANPSNPYDLYSSEFIGEAPPTKLEIYEETVTGSMITKSYSSNEAGYRLVVNCYRGCVHGCTYCFARRYHEFLGYGAGTDFETKLVAKVNAADTLRRNLQKTRIDIPYLEFSFATDPYLSIEANYCLTQECLAVCAEFGVKSAIVTKSPLVTRDIDLLRQTDATVFFSIPFLSKESSNPFEPYAPIPEARFRAMKKMSDAGIEVGIAIAPLILGYNDSEIPSLLATARQNGATKCFMSNLHIDSNSIEKYFVSKLHQAIPTKAEKILNNMRRERNGNLQHKNYQERISGKTERWKIAKEIFNLHKKKNGFVDVIEEDKTEDLAANPVEKAKIFQPKLF